LRRFSAWHRKAGLYGQASLNFPGPAIWSRARGKPRLPERPRFAPKVFMQTNPRLLSAGFEAKQEEEVPSIKMKGNLLAPKDAAQHPGCYRRHRAPLGRSGEDPYGASRSASTYPLHGARAPCSGRLGRPLTQGKAAEGSSLSPATPGLKTNRASYLLAYRARRLGTELPKARSLKKPEARDAPISA
jgi:hypothetical protein